MALVSLHVYTIFGKISFEKGGAEGSEPKPSPRCCIAQGSFVWALAAGLAEALGLVLLPHLFAAPPQVGGREKRVFVPGRKNILFDWSGLYF